MSALELHFSKKIDFVHLKAGILADEASPPYIVVAGSTERGCSDRRSVLGCNALALPTNGSANAGVSIT
ncbi:hypothetical protein K8R78_02880 [bacterium]|nr:hypothetical protein [bacterium]